MTLQECYQAMGGGYEEVLGRLRSEKLIQKFVLKFLADPSYENLHQALNDGNGEEAFRAAHTLKGVSQNLSFTHLYEASHDLAEALRDGKTLTDDQLVQRVDEAYSQAASAIRAFESSIG